MAAVLGVSAEYHDAAAALVVDGRVIAAVQEERLSRVKNDARLPTRAIAECLRLGGISSGELDRVVFYEDPFARLERVFVSCLRRWPRAWRQFSKAMASQLGSRVWVLDRLAELTGVPRARVTHVDHHRSHAAHAFFTSPLEQAAVLTVDGVGESASTALWRGRGERLELIESIEFPHSLGLLYAALTAWLGFEVNEGEYKVMGLAAFGEPRFEAELARLVRVQVDGSFELCLDYFAFETDLELGFSRELERLLGPRRPPGLAWNLESERDRRYAAVAASLQRATETVLVALGRRCLARAGCSSLCVAGGVALNAVANARLARDSGAERVYVPPGAGDAGGALGAALLGALELGAPRPAPLWSAALGPSIDAGSARALASELGLDIFRVSDPTEAAAERLSRGQIVAFAQGRMEFGPRALGQRSILAPPGELAVRERLNRAVKRREPFRPFAPAVLAEHARHWFAGAPDDMTPFMTTVRSVEPSAALHAVTHVDGSARVQTVDADSAPELCRVLEALERRGALPIALNTSLNGAGEPIAASASDAVAFVISHPVDALVVGDLVLERQV